MGNRRLTNGSIVYRLYDTSTDRYVESFSGKNLWLTKSGPVQLLNHINNDFTYAIVNGSYQKVGKSDPNRYEIKKFIVNFTEITDAVEKESSE